MTDGRHDFDFLHGTWHVENRMRRNWLASSDEWTEFTATSVCAPWHGGLMNYDEYTIPNKGGGVSVRTYNTTTDKWTIYWASVGGDITAPVVGRFDGDLGEFFGSDEHKGAPIVVRYQWRRDIVQWNQAYSPDGGETWETNWWMDLKPA